MSPADLPLAISSSSETDVTAEVEVPTESGWFDGHFPGRPMLPGVAITATACRLLRDWRRRLGLRTTPQCIKKVRFRKIVLPGDRLEVGCSLKKTGEDSTFSFQLDRCGQPVCSGIIIASEEEIDG